VVRYLAADEEVFRPNPAARALWADKYAVKPDELIMSSVTLLRLFKSQRLSFTRVKFSLDAAFSRACSSPEMEICSQRSDA